MAKRMGTGFLIGRYQPFHAGHLYVLRTAYSRCKNIVIGVGTSQVSGTNMNPLGAAARVFLIRKAVEGAGLDKKRIRIITIPDFSSDEDWFKYIKKKVPHIDAVFSGNPWVINIFKAHRIKAVKPRNYRGISATKVRNAIRTGKRWEHMVPKGTLKEIKKHEKRIRAIREPKGK